MMKMDWKIQMVATFILAEMKNEKAFILAGYHPQHLKSEQEK